jgi:multidrug efflux system membrane fusion protein
LATIVSVNPVYVSVDVDERAILKYRRQSSHQAQLHGAEVELALTDETDFPHVGYLDYIAPSENPTTGTINVRAVFTNADELLSPGFFARIRLRGNEAYAALLLPDRAIATDQADRFVWVMNQNKAVDYRKVTLGKKIGEWRVIQQGLQAGDWVVIEGVQKLKPGSKIDPEKIALTEQKIGQ